ncbi:MAG: TonB family protein, partial [SAR202 cluster bacterium]|nr:TonB family protein [SAR202 cluster bacterium]
RFLGEAQKITKTIQEEIETFDIPQTEQIKLPEPPARPSVPVASEDEFFDEDITIEDTDLDDFEDWEAPSSDNKKFEFIAREIDPKPYPGRSINDLVRYPELAKEAGLEGKVIVAAYITKKGIPKNAYIMKGVFPSLDDSALDAVNQSRWIPAKNNGKKVAVWVTIPVVFRLK